MRRRWPALRVAGVVGVVAMPLLLPAAARGVEERHTRESSTPVSRVRLSTDAPRGAGWGLREAGTLPGPVPMPEVQPAEPGPVPMPQVRPTEPGPVPMPQVRPGTSRWAPLRPPSAVAGPARTGPQ